MISQYIQLQKATHRGKEIILFKFWNREDWKRIIKKMPLSRFSSTFSAFYIPYSAEAYSSFKNVNIPHKYPPNNDTTESLPSHRAVVDIERNDSSNVRSLLGNGVGDTSISDTNKTELEIIWNTKGFSIQLPYNNDDISFIRNLEKAWWNKNVRLWYIKSSINNLDAIQKRWSYYDKATYAGLYTTIRDLEEPMILEIYTSPEYTASVIFKLKGYRSSPSLIKSLSKRQYDKIYKRWIVPYNEKMIEELISSYEKKGYSIINNMTSAHLKGSVIDDKTKSLKILLSKIEERKHPFFVDYANIFLRLGRSPNTAKPYIIALLKIMGYYRVDDIGVLDEQRINAYLSMLAGGGMSESGLNIVVSAVKFWSKHMHRGEAWNLIEIRRPKKSFTIPKILSENEMRLFLDAIENTKHLCIVYLLYGSGLRAGELLNLQLTDIYWDRQQVHVKGAKGKKDRVVNISKKLIDRMAAYFDVYQPVRYLFEGATKGKSYSYSSMRQIIQRAKKKANISKHVTAHVMRHSFATHNMDAGVPLPYIQQMLGHKDIKTTMIYMHITKNSFSNFESPLDKL